MIDEKKLRNVSQHLLHASAKEALLLHHQASAVVDFEFVTYKFYCNSICLLLTWFVLVMLLYFHKKE